MKRSDPTFWSTSGILKEVHFKASLSGGKGGQNVNKVSTKIELYWSPLSSYVLDDEAKEKVWRRLNNKLSSEGELRVVCEEERSQLKNKEKAIEKFLKLLASCFKEIKPRKATKPTKTSVHKRLEEKSRKKNIKANRGKPDY